MPRRTPPNRVTDIARAACRVFIAKGYHRALMTDVGRNLGLSHARCCTGMSRARRRCSTWPCSTPQTRARSPASPSRCRLRRPARRWRLSTNGWPAIWPTPSSRRRLSMTSALMSAGSWPGSSTSATRSPNDTAASSPSSSGRRPTFPNSTPCISSGHGEKISPSLPAISTGESSPACCGQYRRGHGRPLHRGNHRVVRLAPQGRPRFGDDQRRPGARDGAVPGRGGVRERQPRLCGPGGSP